MIITPFSPKKEIGCPICCTYMFFYKTGCKTGLSEAENGAGMKK